MGPSLQIATEPFVKRRTYTPFISWHTQKKWKVSTYKVGLFDKGLNAEGVALDPDGGGLGDGLVRHDPAVRRNNRNVLCVKY